LRPDSLAWLDPLLAAAHESPSGVTRLTLDVQGVHCAACVWLLQQLWERQRGAIDLCINPALGRAEIAWKAGEYDLRDYLRLVERFGYRFGPARKRDLATSRQLVVRLGVCTAAALNVMIFSLCFYAGLASSEGALYTTLGRWSFALASVALIVGGSLFVSSAARSLRRGIVHLDLPIALGILLGYGGSVWAHFAHGPQAAYFDTITIFIALMLFGRWLQERVLARNQQSLLASDGVDDLYVRRRQGSELETVRATAIEAGDELWVLPGDLVAVESTLLAEPAAMSLDWITGESRQRCFQPGETIPAGAFHAGASAARVCAREPFMASRLQGLIGSAPGGDGDSLARARVDRGWSRFVTAYVIAVLLLAAAGYALWLPAGSERAIAVALSVLVVTCPCALGLATPLANELVHAALRRRGVFLREQDFLRRVLRVRHILFDKTGTLTRGNLRLVPASARAIDALEPAQRALLANACARSLHPVARCIHAHLERDGRTRLIDEIEALEFPGRGLELRQAGHVWRLGRAEFALGESRANVPGTCFTLDGALLLSIEVEEELKADARDEVARLSEAGLQLHLLSGDQPARVRHVAEQLGMAPERVHGGMQPQDKARYVRELDRGDTWMIGDGINDGPAFDAAACAATPAVDRPSLPARADMFYLGDGIAAVRLTLDWAQRLARVVRTNLVLAVAYNLAAVALCLSGHVGPLTAAVLMPASSVGFLTLTSLRLSQRNQPWTS
jgi:Cu2+-exporting ATPase